MRILEYPKGKQVRCRSCSALIEYYSFDVKYHQAEMAYDTKSYHYITCPICNRKERVAKWHE